MSDKQKELQQEMASFVGRLLRDHFGKGPESVFVSIGDKFFTIYLKNFMSPIERVLKQQNHNAILNDVREKLMEKISPDIKTFVEIKTELRVEEMYYDWGIHNQSGIIMGVCNESFGYGEIDMDFPEKKELEQAMIKLSQHAQKAPEEVFCMKINPRTYLVIRNGILVRIEKELVRIGQGHNLKTVKRGMEKSYLHNNINFEHIYDQTILDVFVDWDLERDRSMIALIVDPNRKPPIVPSVEMG